LIDLIGKDLGITTWGGGKGHLPHGPGTMTPWLKAAGTKNINATVVRKNKLINRSISLSRVKVSHPLLRIERTRQETLAEKVAHGKRDPFSFLIDHWSFAIFHLTDFELLT